MKISNTTQKIFKHIVVEISNYESLRRLGHVGESFNDVIAQLIEKKVKSE